ncbi:ATP-binding protein [Streptomyces sp. TRM66268-LWL]|uniref:ATP-binding protein n=1 Tax=Streptomyces polyasparticus TaxID=2767826 RepID=A0ABR7SMA8_9ACTN|nr:ATP-binding protein [Streptomyces polyasparticus]MBC9715722.1 ATP-binding protein [Streptomyces polyasparticus]
MVVRRLLALDETGTLESVHVRIAAETAGVSTRTVWRWLAVARESGRMEPRSRPGGFAFTDELWARLGKLGGNVAELHRELEQAGDTAPLHGPLPSLATLHRAVREDLRTGRVLETTHPRHGHVDPDRYDRALAELALPGTSDETGRSQAATTDQADPVDDAGTTGEASPLTRGVRLYAPGAHLVSTRQVGEVAEALAHTAAARGVLCVYGDTGHGKTVAVHRALRLLPRRVPIHFAHVAVKPALPQLRAALLTAFSLPAKALTSRTDAADRALIDALATPGVLVIDDVQRIAGPELDYLRLLIDAPTTQMSLVLCGAGAERTLARAPALASRVLTWQHTPRLEPAQVPGVLRLFHPLWHTATDADLLHADKTCARGNFRAWAKITSHAYAALSRHPDTTVDHTLLSRACSRLGPTP